jgi:hypothetical protein
VEVEIDLEGSRAIEGPKDGKKEEQEEEDVEDDNKVIFKGEGRGGTEGM